MHRSLADEGIIRRLISAAGAAPSIHNTQPWRFRAMGDLIEVHGDPDRMLWVADPLGRALHLSCGAALFNLRLAIRMTGAKPLVWPLPDPDREPTLLASVQLADGRPPTPQERELADMIGLRHTSRAPFSGQPIPEAVQIGLEQQAGFEFALLRMLSANDAAVVLDLAASADRKLAANFDHRVELGHWIGIAGDDGIPARALGSQPDREPAPVRDFSYASQATPLPAATFEHQPQRFRDVFPLPADRAARHRAAGTRLVALARMPADRHPLRLRAAGGKLAPPRGHRDPRPAGRSRRPHPALAAGSGRRC